MIEDQPVASLFSLGLISYCEVLESNPLSLIRPLKLNTRR
jgi:hypothetical protein